MNHLDEMKTRSLLIVLLLTALAPVSQAQPWDAGFLAKLTAGDAEANDWLGYPVVVDGDVAAVGANGRDESLGAVFIYRQQADGTWAEEARLMPGDGAPDDQFGIALALDDDVLLVGALQHSAGGHRTGAAYVFQYEDGAWTEQGKILAGDASEGAFFGEGVALGEDHAFISATGVATVYVYDRDTWTEQARLVPFDTDVNRCFGCALAVDGDYVIVGDSDAQDDQVATEAAYVYRREAGGDWIGEAKLTPGAGPSEATFGSRVAIGEGMALVGAPWDDEHGPFAGAAYLFTREEGVWSDPTKLIPGDIEERKVFGRSVALEGRRAFIGASGNNDGIKNAGAVYVFSPDQTGAWVEVGKMVPDDATESDGFGSSLAVDRGVALIGTPFADDAAENAGAVYVYSLPNTAPMVPHLITPADGAAIDLSGDPAQAFTVAWNPATDPDGDALTYTWQLRLSDDFAEPLLTLDAGTGTTLETTYGTIATALTAGGVDLHETVTVHHRIVASDGKAQTPGVVFQLELTRGVITDMEDAEILPEQFVLYPAYPNPFNPTTTIPYVLPEASRVRLAVYDLLGREVALLADGVQAAGAYTASFKAGHLPSGVYLVRMEAGTFIETQRVTLLK